MKDDVAPKTTLELVKAALEGRSAARLYPIPGIPGTGIAMRTLTDREVDNCRRRAADYCEKRKMALVIDPSLFDRVLRREIIAACCFQGTEEGAHYFFSQSDEVGELDDQTVIALYEQYQIHRELCAPWDHGGEEEVDALAEALGKLGNGVAQLSSFDAPTLRSLLLSMARRLRAISPTSG